MFVQLLTYMKCYFSHIRRCNGCYRCFVVINSAASEFVICFHLLLNPVNGIMSLCVTFLSVVPVACVKKHSVRNNPY